MWGYAGSIEDILLNYSPIKTINYSNCLTLNDIKKEITYKNPFIIRWGWTAGGGHFMLGTGVSGNSVYYMNPLPGNGAQIGNYTWMVNDNSNHAWTHSQTFCAPLKSVDGNTIICNGAWTTYSVNDLPDAQFTWTFPNGWSGSSTSSSVTVIPGSNSGNVLLTYTDRCNSTDTKSLSVSVTKIDTAVSYSGKGLMASQTQATYQWLRCPSQQSITGATSQLYVPSSGGNFAVKITKNGCVDTSACRMVAVTGISGYNWSGNGLSVFPTPVTQQLSVSISSLTKNSALINITDVLGKCVFTREYAIDEAELNTVIDVSGFASGIYYLTVSGGEQPSSIKFVKE
jgi:hypothetical protein